LTRLLDSAIKVDSIFTSYRIQSNASNEISVSLSSEALLAALKSAASPSTYEAEEVVVKLAKKNDLAVLSFEISGQTIGGRKVRVTHDVRIEVMKPADMERLSEPMCPEPDVSPMK
jgi:HUS1 checkpoint protein